MFRIEDGRDSFYQWDTNRKIIVGDSTIQELHFCNKTEECSLVVEVKDGVANVPNILLQTDWDIRVYGFTVDYTKVEKRFKVVARTKPSDYIYTETELKNYDALSEVVEAQGERITEVEEAAYETYLLADETADNLNNIQEYAGTAFLGSREVNLTADGCYINDIVPFNHEILLKPKSDYKVRNYLDDYLNHYSSYNETNNGLTLTLNKTTQGEYNYSLTGKSTTPTTFMIMPINIDTIMVNYETLYGCVCDTFGDYIKGAFLSLCDENYFAIRVDEDTKIEGIHYIQAINLTIPAGSYNNRVIRPFLTNNAIEIYNDNTGDLLGFYPMYKNYYSFQSGGCDVIYLTPVEQIQDYEHLGVEIHYNRTAHGLITKTQEDGFILVWGNQAFKVNAEPIEDYEW